MTTRREFFGVSSAAVVAILQPRRADAAPPGYELRVLVAAEDDATTKIVQALLARFPGGRSSSSLETLTTRRGPAVYVTVGASALQRYVDSGTTAPAVATFLSNEAFTRLKAKLVGDRRSDLLTAIYAEAGPPQQMQLVRALYSRRITVGVLLSPSTAHVGPAVESAAKAAGLDVDVQVLAQGDNVLRSFAAMRDAKVLLTVPDREIYTPETARYLLESAYRRNVGVIGFSTALVKAGALAAAFSTIDDVAAQLPSVADVAAQGRVPSASYPLYWRVDINDRIAQSLSLVVDDRAKSLGNFPGAAP